MSEQTYCNECTCGNEVVRVKSLLLKKLGEQKRLLVKLHSWPETLSYEDFKQYSLAAERITGEIQELIRSTL